MTGARKAAENERERFSATRRRLVTTAAAVGLERTLFGQHALAAQEKEDVMPPVITHINPDDMHQNPAFTQAVSVQGAAKTIYIGGQNAVDADGNIVGAGDLAAQSEQIFRNLSSVLAAAGGSLQDIIKMTIFVAQDQDIRQGFGAFQSAWGTSAPPPAISVAMVAGLAHPDFLVEIEAIAVTSAEA